MNICIYATSLAETGGIESHLVQFCRKLAKEGHQLSVVCANSRLNSNWERNIQGVAEYRTAKIRNPLMRIIWQLSKGLILRGSKFDVLYTNGQGSSVYWFAKATGIKRWIHHHHMSADVSDQKMWSRSYKRCLQDCTQLIACASINAERLEAVTGRHTEVIYCFSYQAKGRNSSFNANQKLRFGYFGRLIPAKGLPMILSLSNDDRLNEIEWHVWGHGSDFDCSELDQSQTAHFHGPFSSEEELEDILGSLDAFVLFSTFDEGLPLCLIEAMGRGLPWIATDRGGIAELSRTSEDLILLSSNPNHKECLDACVLMAERIRKKKIDHKTIIHVYNKRFSDAALLNRWESCLSATK